MYLIAPSLLQLIAIGWSLPAAHLLAALTSIVSPVNVSRALVLRMSKTALSRVAIWRRTCVFGTKSDWIATRARISSQSYTSAVREFGQLMQNRHQSARRIHETILIFAIHTHTEYILRHSVKYSIY